MKWRFVRDKKSGQVNHQCLESDVGRYFIAKYLAQGVDKYIPWQGDNLLLPRGQWAKTFEQAKTICEEHYATNK